MADLLKYYGHDVTIQHQKLGDICSEHCIVERKEFNDYVSSIIDRRLFSQTKRMMYSDKPSFLLVHGVWDIKRHITEKQVGGAIASTLVRTAIPTLVLLTRDKRQELKNFSQAMYVAGKICEKVEEGKFLEPKLYKRWHKPQVPYRILKLAVLLGVPKLVAARLLKEFKSIRGVCNASFQELLRVEGIGEVRAQNIIKLVHRPKQ